MKCKFCGKLTYGESVCKKCNKAINQLRLTNVSKNNLNIMFLTSRIYSGDCDVWKEFNDGVFVKGKIVNINVYANKGEASIMFTAKFESKSENVNETVTFKFEDIGDSILTDDDMEV